MAHSQAYLDHTVHTVGLTRLEQYGCQINVITGIVLNYPRAIHPEKIAWLLPLVVSPKVHCPK